MIFIDEMKNLKIYRKQFFLPYNDKDKKHGSNVYLLTPNYMSSKRLMSSPLTINRRYFESYYFERNAAYYINSGKVPQDEVLSEAVSEQISSAIHNGFDYESFDEYMLVPKETEVSSENNTYYETIKAAIDADKLVNGGYDVYIHPVDHPKIPTYLGTIEVQVLQFSDYDAIYKWTNWEYIEDEGEYTGDDYQIDDTVNEITDYCDNDYSVPILNRYNIVSKDGADNACVKISGYEKPCRGRSSILCIKEEDDKTYVFISRNSDGSIKAPGGGWNINETPRNAAIRELEEEAYMLCKDVRHCGHLIEYHEQVQDWVKDHVNEEDWWYGYYTEIFVGRYNGDYKGVVADEDKDEIKESGKWVELEEFYKLQPVEYVDAVKNYLEMSEAEAIQEAFTNDNQSLLEQLENILLEISQSDLDKNAKLDPVFVVNTYTGTTFGKIVKKITNAPYSHVLISFDSSLSNMYSFDFGKKINPNDAIQADGFVIDNLNRYKIMATNNMRVLAIMVTPKVKKAMLKTIDFYRENMAKTRYGFDNLLGYLKGSKKISSFKELKMFCSEFVDSILKSVNIDISGKTSRNVAPSDLGLYSKKNNFYLVFEGRASEYDEEKVNELIASLKQTIPHAQLNGVRTKKLGLIKEDETLDLADKLKYMVRKIKMKNKRGIYRFNKERRDADNGLPTVDQIQNSVTVSTPSVSSGTSATVEEMAKIKSALNYEDPDTYFLNEDKLILLGESEAKYDSPLRKMLWQDRMRSNKEALLVYNKVKTDLPFIKYTFLQLDRYQGRNLFYDLSYYNEIFFAHNTIFKMDKAVDLYFDFMSRLINPARLPKSYTKKTMLVPILDWVDDPKIRTWLYRDNINPISVIHRMMVRNMAKVKQLFGDMDVIFMAPNCYFKINFSTLTAEQEKTCQNLFKTFIVKIEKGQTFSADEEDDTPKDQESNKVIVTNIVDKVEKARKVDMSTKSAYIGAVAAKSFVGYSPAKPVMTKPVEFKPMAVANKDKKEEIKKSKEDSEKILKATTTDNNISKEGKDQKQADIEAKEKEKEELINKITDIAARSMNTDDAIEKMDNEDDIKELIMKLSIEDESGIKMNSARVDRMNKLNNEFLQKEVFGMKIKDILATSTDMDKINAPLPTTAIETESPFADQWKNLTYINFGKTYDINEDIVKMLDALSKKQYPISVRNLTINDNSTSEDYIDTYQIEIEDFRGKRSTIKLDIPKFKDNKYLILRGNKKTIQNQYFNMPILKTDQDTVQIITNYNKIFIRRFGNTKGKTITYADRLIKTLGKYDGRNIKVVYGDNSKLSDYYDMPMDYIDLGSVIHSIEFKDKEGYTNTIYFNQKEIREKYVDIFDATKGMPYLYKTNGRNGYLLYYNSEENNPISEIIINILSEDEKFAQIFNATTSAKRYVYSQASILNQRIPLIIVCAYSAGLLPTLQKANIQFEMVEKLTPEIRHDYRRDWIRFSDGYLVYFVNYESSLLLNGLKEIDTTQYSVEDINSKRIYVEMLDNYGGRIIADGLENFAECMIDPITEEVLAHYKLPGEYVDLLVAANNLLADNVYIAHGDASSRRLRRNELIAVKVYKSLFNDAYSAYATGLRHNRNNTVFTVRQSAVIDKFMTDTISSDLSIANCLNDVETANSITTKGESGMNSARSYTLDKRIYDKSMLNLMGMSTGFAGTVGVTRQATINMNIDGKRGYVKSIDGDTSKMNTASSLTITEALNPMTNTHDDPVRVAMTFVQTSKHQVRTEKSDPLIVSNGADEVLPYLTTDIFCKKSEKAGTVKEITDKYMVVEYTDGTNDYVDLSDRIEKNSDGGFFVGVKLDTDLAVGQKVKPNQILAYDKKSFSKGKSANSKLLTYDVGRLAKVAIINSDDNFEDSAMITSKLAEDLSTDVILQEERMLDASTNIYNFLKVGMDVQQEDILYETQTAYEDEDINILLKNLAGDEEQISKLGRRPVKSPVTGKIVGIKVYRTCELEDMSESLRKFCELMEAPSRATERKLKSLGITDPTLTGSTKKLDPIGKMKNCPNCVLIEYYIQYHDIMAVGDKLTIFSANKGVVHSIIESSNAPFTDFRPNEEISIFTGIATINKRQIASNLIVGSLNKLCVELGRSVRDILGMPYMEDEI